VVIYILIGNKNNSEECQYEIRISGRWGEKGVWDLTNAKVNIHHW
jgi:hypothetical protein